MEKISITGKLIKLLIRTGFILLISLNSGCAGDRIEYDPPDPRLIGKVVRFDKPMAYMILSGKDAKDYNAEAIKIGRVIMSVWDLDNQYGIFYKHPREYLRESMNFTIIGSYWVRGDWFTREFAPDLHDVVLEDENGIRSVCSISIISSIETDIKGELK